MDRTCKFFPHKKAPSDRLATDRRDGKYPVDPKLLYDRTRHYDDSPYRWFIEDDSPPAPQSNDEPTH